VRIDILTIFPSFFESPLREGIIHRACERGVLDIRVHDLRGWTTDRHRVTDDAPYGGGAGMVMKPEPWGEALRAVLAAGSPDEPVVLVVPTPSGRPFRQADAHAWAGVPRLVFACGRYEGIDARVATWAAQLRAGGVPVRVEEVSIGDYVLAGAEAAVLVMVEAVARLVPGVLGNEASHADDSFAPGGMERLLEGPVYTRPPVWEGLAVPEVLTSGDHAAVARWRHEQALARTRAIRPDLLEDPADG
jgi:tRNA (guanine37-N1)-methyltransferase